MASAFTRNSFREHLWKAGRQSRQLLMSEYMTTAERSQMQHLLEARYSGHTAATAILPYVSSRSGRIPSNSARVGTMHTQRRIFSDSGGSSGRAGRGEGQPGFVVMNDRSIHCRAPELSRNAALTCLETKFILFPITCLPLVTRESYNSGSLGTATCSIGRRLICWIHARSHFDIEKIGNTARLLFMSGKTRVRFCVELGASTETCGVLCNIILVSTFSAAAIKREQETIPQEMKVVHIMGNHMPYGHVAIAASQTDPDLMVSMVIQSTLDHGNTDGSYTDFVASGKHAGAAEYQRLSERFMTSNIPDSGEGHALAKVYNELKPVLSIYGILHGNLVHEADDGGERIELHNALKTSSAYACFVSRIMLLTFTLKDWDN
ncbi:hypothetical protein GOP47_0028435 [Adiantum capillus-veneris]|nr:hypothetical protein GOP47_0028435 [Adiantum capillus-veneris]